MAAPLTLSPGKKADRRVPPSGQFIKLKFGGGLHTRASEEDINQREASDGQNFLLDQENFQLRNRPPFDLLDTAPNAAEIRGIVTLRQSDGTVQMAVQAGDTVYAFDGASFGATLATVSATARLRGTLESQWVLDDKVLIADLNLSQQMMEWDGTTFTTMTEDLTGAFKARYSFVDSERAWFANVESNAITTPHLIAVSAVEDYGALDVSNKPSSSLGDADPFYFLTPDLRPVNGILNAFDTVLISSCHGSIHRLTGSTAKDFALIDFYAASACGGDEAFTYVGNDVVYGRPGRLETIIATDKFGDVQADDITVPIGGDVIDVNEWQIIYNSRFQRIYCFDQTGNLYVYNKNVALSTDQVSPWSKWRTAHASNFQPTAIMRAWDPTDSLEYVFFGDSSGNFYRMEGSGASGDAGSTNIKTEFLSKLFEADVDADIFNVTGWLSYRAAAAQTVTLNFEWSGESVFNESITINLPAVGYTTVYSGPAYYGGAFYYGAQFEGRLTREKFGVTGRSNQMQCRVTVESADSFEINEIGLKFEQAGAKP